MHKIFKRFLASALLACFPLLFSACGGGGGGGGVEMTTISGTAVKGPIKGALVQVFKLNSDGTRGELLGSGTSGSGGLYGIQIPKAKAIPPLLVTVTGQEGATYKSETTGIEVPFTSAESFNAALDTFNPDNNYTVSPLTEAAFEQVQRILTDNPSLVADDKTIGAANARVATLFNVSDILADPAADPAYAASLQIIDQMVVNSGTSTTLQVMALINQAFVDVGSKPYQSFQSALTAAANDVIAAAPPADAAAIAAVINAVVAAANNPPPEPDWTDTTPPQAVKNLQAVPGSEATSSFVTLFWSVATTTGKNPVAGYDVYRNGIKIASVTSTTYLDKPLQLSTAYKYYVVAFDAAGNRSLASAEISTTTPAAPNLTITAGGQLSSGIISLTFKDITAPAAPANLAATSSVITATISSVSLSWSASTDNVAVTGYDVYRDGSKLGTVPQTSFTDLSVTSGVVHSYTVVAFDAAGNRSAMSAALLYTPVTSNLNITVGGQLSTDTTNQPFKDITAPTVPQNLAAVTTAIDATTSSVKLTWSAATDNVAVAGYDVYRGGVKIGTVTQATYTDPSVTSGVASSYAVIAFDAAGNRSAASSALSVTPVSPNLGITVGGQVS